ncbi:hypothetical protein M3Y97_00201700 [Aphelenchoides bicaudatus]|nr:hypothetical protein M3Y97_00201700 [Aphelenchoides bicaudatus]
MAFTFKLANPGEKIGPNVCLVPQWLEEHLSQVSSEFDEETLGNVSITAIQGDPYNYSENVETYGNYYNYHNNPSTQTASTNQKGHIDERLDESFEENVQNEQTTTRAVHPKTFCDNLYMRLVGILYSISDEQKVVQAQSKLETLVGDLEATFFTSIIVLLFTMITE